MVCQDGLSNGKCRSALAPKALVESCYQHCSHGPTQLAVADEFRANVCNGSLDGDLND